MRGLLISSTYATRFFDNTRIFFQSNGVALLKRRGLLKSKLVYAPLLRTIDRQQYRSLFSEEI